jgi:hypothetical protein
MPEVILSLKAASAIRWRLFCARENRTTSHRLPESLRGLFAREVEFARFVWSNSECGRNEFRRVDKIRTSYCEALAF